MHRTEGLQDQLRCLFNTVYMKYLRQPRCRFAFKLKICWVPRKCYDLAIGATSGWDAAIEAVGGEKPKLGDGGSQKHYAGRRAIHG